MKRFREELHKRAVEKLKPRRWRHQRGKRSAQEATASDPLGANGAGSGFAEPIIGRAFTRPVDS
jgi:hypothetical protein